MMVAIFGAKLPSTAREQAVINAADSARAARLIELNVSKAHTQAAGPGITTRQRWSPPVIHSWRTCVSLKVLSAMRPLSTKHRSMGTRSYPEDAGDAGRKRCAPL